MSLTMIVLIVVLGLLAVTLLFLVAVLRSHAELLRRLGAVEDRLDAGGAPVPGPDPQGAVDDAEAVAADIAGETLAGDVVKLSLGDGAPRTLLAFLSSGCAACRPLWDELAAAAPSVPADVRTIIVTKGRDAESLSALQRVAPVAGRGEVVMSSAAYRDYAVPATPHFVLVGDGRRILGRGGATSWQQILSLLGDADADQALHGARSTSDRAARAEQALAAAGIGRGHPSLYPSRRDGDD